MGIYIFGHILKPYIKVGFHGSANPWLRIASQGFEGNICPEGLNTEPVGQYKLLAWFPTLGYSEESEILAQFRKTCVCGEWWPATQFSKIYSALSRYNCADTSYEFTHPMDNTSKPQMRVLISYDFPLESKDLLLSLLPNSAALKHLGIEETRFITVKDSPLMKAIDAATEPEPKKEEEPVSKPKQRRAWTDAEREKLFDLFFEGNGITVVAKQLGRTIHAVQIQLRNKIIATIQADGEEAARKKYTDKRLVKIWEEIDALKGGS